MSLNSGRQAKNETEHTGHTTDNWQSGDTQYLQFDRNSKKLTPVTCVLWQEFFEYDSFSDVPES